MSSTSRQPDKIGYSIKEAIAATSLGRSTLYRYIGEGTLRVVRIGGRTIIPADALHALIADADARPQQA